MAKNEQLRADLLRAISHDLRTPLCSISGNADMLLHNGKSLDDRMKPVSYTHLDVYKRQPIKHLCKEINSKQIKYNSQLAISEHQFDYLSVQMLRVILSELVRLGLDIVVFRDNHGYRFNDYVEIFWNKTSC